MLNCHEITTQIQVIRTKKAELDILIESKNIQAAQALQAELKKLGAELGVELETPHEEALKLSQQVFDKIFADTPYQDYNFKKKYLAGELALFDPAQEKAALKEGYDLKFIFPGHIPRADFIQIFNQKYAQEFRSQVSSDGVGVWFSDKTRQDQDQTKASQAPAGQGQMMVIRAQNNTLEAHPDTVNLNLSAQKTHLQELQAQNSNFNLRGLTLPEYLFADACIWENQGHHLDEKGWSYLLEEEITASGRALYAVWSSDRRQVVVGSDSGAGSVLGARFVAVSHIPVPLNP